MKYFLQDIKNYKCHESDTKELDTNNKNEALQEAENFYFEHLTPYEQRCRTVILWQAETLDDVLEQTSDCKMIWDSSRWEALTSLMNDEIREEIHNELAPCTTSEFLKKYLELDPNFIESVKQEFNEFLELI